MVPCSLDQLDDSGLGAGPFWTPLSSSADEGRAENLILQGLREGVGMRQDAYVVQSWAQAHFQPRKNEPVICTVDCLVKFRSFPFSLNTPLSWEHSELPSWSHIPSLYGPQQGCHSQEPTLLHGLVKTNVLPVQGHHCPPRCSCSSPKLGPPPSPLYQG